MPLDLLSDPYGDRSPALTVEIGPLGGNTDRPIGLQRFTNISEYCYDNDILQIGDPVSIKLSNPDGAYSNKIQIGDTIQLGLTDPDVGGGTKVSQYIGVVTEIDMQDDALGGSRIVVSGADLGWHLVNNCGPLFHRYRGKSLNAILQDVLDRQWGFLGVRGGNELNQKAKQGRAGIINPSAVQGFQVVPPIQWDPGMMIADVLVTLARRQKLLLNVSSDGYLQFFKPNYTQAASYVFHHHKATESDRTNNNVESARLRQSIDGQYTAVTCVGQVAYTPFGANVPGHFNQGKLRKDYFSTATLPFPRRISFGDYDQMDDASVANRAQWKWQRGQFDSWTYEITVRGHSQNGLFYAPDTICEVNDSVFGISGKRFYVAAVRFARTMQHGTTTTLRIHKADVLGA